MVVADFLHRAQLFSIFGQSAELGTGRFREETAFDAHCSRKIINHAVKPFGCCLWQVHHVSIHGQAKEIEQIYQEHVYTMYSMYTSGCPWTSQWYSGIGCLILDSYSLLKKYNISSPTYICLNLYQLPIDFRSKFTRQRFTGPISGGGGGRTPTVFQKILFCDHTKSKADTRWVQFLIGSLCKLPGKEALDKILKGAIFWSQPKISLPPISSPYLLAPFCKDLTTGNKIANGTF